MQAKDSTRPGNPSVKAVRRGSPIVFSTTELGDSLQRCEQAWYWSSLNGLGLERPLPSSALALGSLVHYTMADWGTLYALRHQPAGTIVATPDIFVGEDPDPAEIFNAHFERFKTNVYERYEAWRHQPMDQSEWQSYEDEVGELGEAMITNYYRYWGSPFPEDCTLLSPEITIVRPLPKVRKNQRQLWLEGTLDQLLLDADGNLYPRDFKTFEKETSSYELDTNDQFMTYCHLALEEFPGYALGGFAYDGLWKRKGVTDRMRRSDGSKRDESDLFKRQYLMYSEEKIRNHAMMLPWRAYKAYSLLNARRRHGPAALDKSRWWATCSGCSFNDLCGNLLDGDFGEWDADAEAEMFQVEEYIKRVKTPAWRTPLPELAKSAA